MTNLRFVTFQSLLEKQNIRMRTQRWQQRAHIQHQERKISGTTHFQNQLSSIQFYNDNHLEEDKNMNQYI